MCTFNLINYVSNNTTSFKESYFHKWRYQLLLKQHPTIEFLKLTSPHLYDPTWKCCRCNSVEEDFNHIWTFLEARSIINNIINEGLQTLKNQLYIHTSNNQWSFELQSLFDTSHPFWNLSSPSTSSFTFIDFIKGIVPFHFYHTINDFTKCQKKSLAILSSFYNFIIDQSIFLIWKPRCVLTIAKELTLDITNKKKRSRSNNNTTHSSSRAILSVDNNMNHLTLFSNSFIHGRSWPLFSAMKTSCRICFSFLLRHVLIFLL